MSHRKLGRLRIETLAQAEVQNLRRIDMLVDRVPDIAAALEACDRKARCGLVICAVCSRAYRFDDFVFLVGAKRRGGRIVIER